MDSTEIMVTEEAAQEIVTTGFDKGLTMAAGVGLGVLGSILAYRFIIKPIRAALKKRRNKAAVTDEEIINEEYKIGDEYSET